MKILLSIFLPVLSLPVFSRLWGRIVRLRRPRFLVKMVIRNYQQAYQIDMDEYQGETEDYASLVEFFTRRLDPERRPLQPNENAIVSPADGILSNIEKITGDQATQVKGKTYSISELIGENIDFSPGWYVATVYLSPSNYHRYHYPLTGNVKRYLHAGTRLFPVNQIGVTRVDRLFIRNERIVAEIERQNMPCYVVAVGATFVGSIKMEFIPAGTRKKRGQWIPVNLEVGQLQEMGRFEMGSTIVMVVPSLLAEPLKDRLGQAVRVGEPLFRLKTSKSR